MKLVFSALPPDQAESVARALVVEHLAACIQLLPVRSVYRWQGDLCVEAECTLLAKVAAHGVERLVDRLRELHPYELPEIVVVPVDSAASLPDYVQWVRDETAPPTWGIEQGDKT